VTTLNDVAPFDWREFLQTRLNSTDVRAPLGGIERGGWKLTYQATPNAYLRDWESVRQARNWAIRLACDWVLMAASAM
jgi:hypothetical protein